MLDFLTGNSPQAQLIRQVFVLFIVPVLNPDGVVYGNNRCSLAGVDLNRQWKIPAKTVHPTIWTLKTFMQFQKKLRDVHMYLDLHGHSRKYNVFMYGCDEKKKSKPQVRAFPKFFSAHPVGGKYVCFADCSFHVRKGRESTARVVVSRELNIPMSFTLEATFCGSNYGPYENCHMNVGHMQEVGASLCDAILQFSIAEGAVKDALVVPPAIKASFRLGGNGNGALGGAGGGGGSGPEELSTLVTAALSGGASTATLGQDTHHTGYAQKIDRSRPTIVETADDPRGGQETPVVAAEEDGDAEGDDNVSGSEMDDGEGPKDSDSDVEGVGRAEPYDGPAST